MASLSSTATLNDYRYKLVFQKCLYFNQCLYIVWVLTIGIILTLKVYTEGYLSMLTTYLAITVFSLVVVLEATRLVIGQIATTRNRVPEMGGFLLITNFMQLPLVSFFLFNPYLRNLPVEIILNAALWMFALIETLFGYIELKEASAIASSVYLAQYKEKNSHSQGDKRKTNA